MQVIGQNDHGFDREWSALPGCLEPSPEIVNGVGQEFSAALQLRDREKERAARNKGASVWRHDFRLP
jgi:hypothetical protein